VTAAEVVRDATTRSLADEDGSPVVVKPRPGLSETEIDDFGKRLPCPLPQDVRELLAYCSGFEEGPLDVVDFTGLDCSFAYEDAFPYGHPIAGDGFGNFWVVDLLPSSTLWGQSTSHAMMRQ